MISLFYENLKFPQLFYLELVGIFFCLDVVVECIGKVSELCYGVYGEASLWWDDHDF